MSLSKGGEDELVVNNGLYTIKKVDDEGLTTNERTGPVSIHLEREREVGKKNRVASSPQVSKSFNDLRLQRLSSGFGVFFLGLFGNLNVV